MDRQTDSRKPRCCCKLLRTLSPHHRSYTYSYVRDVLVYVQVDSLPELCLPLAPVSCWQLHSSTCTWKWRSLTTASAPPEHHSRSVYASPRGFASAWLPARALASHQRGRQPCKQLLVAADEPGDAHPGGATKGAATPAFELRSHYAQKPSL